ncbi:carbohydrate ABC transporter permease [Pelagibacterium xiamenense]|uniref:carbohydrate ABC transporter permease n=1 Tax=Pelagibacterium xiamenense TaxID=2901140 RepID=UPI001E4CA354|nr:carbohydrate ABC transporter permease [Pelagibacterium xiamenense]MCD7059799.1 carbohydrate ABC transporter permease [Pelagibacterium xiamenense]
MLQSRGIRIASWVILIALSLTMIVPLINVVATSFTSKAGSLQPGVILWPEPFSVEGYFTLMNRMRIWLPFMNTMYVTIVGTALHVVLCAVAGYALSNENLPGRNWIVAAILFTLAIPTQTILVPLFIVFRDFGLLNTLLSLILVDLVTAFSIVLMKTYFEQVPKEIIESATMDGAGHLRLFWNFYMPLALPGVITITVFHMVTKYNLFIHPLLFISDPDKTTLQIALQSVVGGEGSTFTSDFIAPNVMMAGIVAALIPLLIFFAFFQRYLISGVTAGGVKG